METEPDYLFDFYLAEKLGKTLDEVRRMPAHQWMEWGIYFGRKAQAKQMAALQGR